MENVQGRRLEVLPGEFDNDESLFRNWIFSSLAGFEV